MEPGGINVSRTLPVDGALLDDVLLRLRRDAPGGALRWTLGERGTVEIDANFTPGIGLWHSGGTVWDHSGFALARVALRLRETHADAVELSLVPAAALPRWWGRRVSELLDLLHAAVDELAEELLWHASRVGLT
jgi:hypothetical protein